MFRSDVRAFLLPLSLLIVACQGGSSDPGSEPNGSILEADVVELDKTLEFKIDSNGDRDWVGMSVPDTGYVHLGSKKVPEKIQPRLRFARKQEWKQQKQKWISGWNSFPKALRVSDKDTLYIAIKDQHDNAHSSKAFKVRMSYIEEFDPHEANGSWKKAREMETGKELQAYLFPKVDRDWFIFRADSAGYLFAQARSVPSGIQPRVRFARKDPDFQKLKEMSGNSAFPAGVRVPEKGRYFLHMKDQHQNGSSRSAIEWKVEFMAEMDSTEPNNEMDLAEPLSIPDTVSLAIFPKGDMDYFKLSSEQERKVLVHSDASPEAIQPRVRWYVRKGAGLGTKKASGWNELPMEFEMKGGKEYFLRVKDQHSNGRSPKPFKLMVRPQKGSAP